MADEGMSEDEAQALADEISRTTGHGVDVLAEDGHFVVEVRRTAPGDTWTLRDEGDWEAFGRRIRAKE